MALTQKNVTLWSESILAEATSLSSCIKIACSDKHANTTRLLFGIADGTPLRGNGVNGFKVVKEHLDAMWRIKSPNGDLLVPKNKRTLDGKKVYDLVKLTQFDADFVNECFRLWTGGKDKPTQELPEGVVTEGTTTTFKSVSPTQLEQMKSNDEVSRKKKRDQRPEYMALELVKKLANCKSTDKARVESLLKSCQQLVADMEAAEAKKNAKK